MSAVQIAHESLKAKVMEAVEKIPPTTSMADLVILKTNMVNMCRDEYAARNASAYFYVLVVGVLAALYRIKQKVLEGHAVESSGKLIESRLLKCGLCQKGLVGTQTVANSCNRKHLFCVSCMKDVISRGATLCPGHGCASLLRGEWIGTDQLFVAGPADMVREINTLFAALYPSNGAGPS